LGVAANQPRPVVTLLTDYGPGTEHVGALHAVVASICPEADRVDLAHDIPPGDVIWGALLFDQLSGILRGGVHLAVVDPGVGTARRGVAIGCEDGRVLVGPDNGLLSLAARRWRPTAAVALATPYEASATFHGRDVFAPASARLAAGAPLGSLGETVDVDSLTQINLPQATVSTGRIEATVLGADRFGNLTLAALPDDLAVATFDTGEAPVIQAGPVVLRGRIGRTFADVPRGEALVYVDAHGLVSVAINGGNAREQLSAKPAETIILTLQPR
jgi:S-adenosyl-L-methionine hydrolase (adenosine-forming)